MSVLLSIWLDGSSTSRQRPAWTPCLRDPVLFDCGECEIGWDPCRLREDDTLRHWQAAWHNRHAGALSAEEERDNEIEKEIVQFLRSHGVAVSADLLFDYLPPACLGSITRVELGNLLKKSPNLVESSPGMFSLSVGIEGEEEEPFRPLPVSSGTELASLVEHFPSLDLPKQTELFKEYSGLRLMASFSTWREAKSVIEEIIDSGAEEMARKYSADVRTIYKYALNPDPVPYSSEGADDKLASINRFFSAIVAYDMMRRIGPKEASELATKARQYLFLSNIRLILRLVRSRAQGDFFGFADLFQSGAIGLMTAIERFDAFRGYRFSTFANHWIHQRISRDHSDMGRNIRIPVHMVEELSAFGKNLDDLLSEFQREPTIDEVAPLMGLDGPRVEFLLELSVPIVSLDWLLEMGREVRDDLVWDDPMNDEVIREMDEAFLRDGVARSLSTLSIREAEIIRLRFGIGGRGPYTLERIGQVFGVTRERVRQIEYRALKKLQHPSRARALRRLWW